MYDNTILAMVKAIASFLQEQLCEMRFCTKDGKEKAPLVYEGYLPPKKNRRGDSSEYEEYPFIIVRFLDAEDEINKQSIANFRILLGIYNSDEQNGWKDVAGLIDRIKFELKRKGFIGAGELTGKIESAIFEEQMKPSWHGIMDISFKMPQVQQEVGVIEDDFFSKNY